MYDRNTTIDAFLTAAAAKQPAPGGGSATALTGALAASMGEMVLAYSIDKNRWKLIGRSCRPRGRSLPVPANSFCSSWSKIRLLLKHSVCCANYRLIRLNDGKNIRWRCWRAFAYPKPWRPPLRFYWICAARWLISAITIC